MIEKIASGIFGQMVDEGIIEEEIKESYIYAFVTVLERTITIGTIFLISLVVKQFLQTVFFILFFISLRKRTGGFHFKTFRGCYFGTVIAYLLIWQVVPVLTHFQPIVLSVNTIAIGLVVWIGTVNHPNMHMTDTELSESKKAARILVILEGCVIYYSAFVEVNCTYISYMSCAIILCAALMCIAKIIKQEVNEHETDKQECSESY